MLYGESNLFQLQTELIDTKVEMAAAKASDRILARIDGLQKDMDNRFTSLEKDIIAVKTRLGMNNETQSLVRARLVDYAFKTGWIILAVVIATGSTLLATYLPALKAIV